MNENERMVRDAVGALVAGDLEKFSTFFADDVVCIYRNRAERDRTTYERPHVDVHHVANGRVARFWWGSSDRETVQRALA